MIDLKMRLALVLTLGLAGFASAQETPTPADPAVPAATTPAPVIGDAVTPAADGLAIGEEVPVDGAGATYTQEVFGDWALNCVRSEEGDDPCQLYQLLKDDAGNAVAEVSLFALPAGQQAVAGATIVTPLETLLTEDIVIQVDGGKSKRYPFTWCSPIGCVARVGFTAEDVTALKAGAKAALIIVPVAAPDQKVNLNLSLTGFTAGFDAVAKLVKP